ncbi:uncharacterized protein PG998_009734 [Apiospora kogelbergensis]|uniref:uncharacterized protein n=1 Tax=Apiospora kogelbergensis TaxID=1337665 RepID=UPI00312E2CF3
MAWQMRNRVASDKSLEEYDKRVAAREAEIRRPARKIQTFTDAELRQMARPGEFRRRWQKAYIDAVRQQNNLVRCKLFLFFQANFQPSEAEQQEAVKKNAEREAKNAEMRKKQWASLNEGKTTTIHRDEEEEAVPSRRAQAAVCRSITKDFLLYCMLGMVDYQESMAALAMRGLSRRSLLLAAVYLVGTRVDEDDLVAVDEAARRKASPKDPPSALITSQMSRDLKDMEVRVATLDSLMTIPGYSVSLSWSLDRIVSSFKPSESDWRDDEQYVASFHRAFTRNPSWTADMSDLRDDQVAAIKAISDSRVKVRRLQQFFREQEWSRDRAMLVLEQEVLASIVNDDAVRKVLLETILEAYLTCGKLVEVAARIRNQAFTSDDALSKEAEFDKEYEAAREDFSNMEYKIQEDVSSHSGADLRVFDLGEERNYVVDNYDRFMMF